MGKKEINAEETLRTNYLWKQENFSSRIFWFSPVRSKDLQPGIEKVEITIVHHENTMNGSCKNLLASVRGFQLTAERGINLSEVHNWAFLRKKTSV